MTLPELIDLMTRTRALKVKTADFEVELHPLAFSSDLPGKPGIFGESSGEAKCNCEHALTEHSEDGLCLQGCSADACGMPQAAPNP
jgi:hypothetical protein